MSRTHTASLASIALSLALLAATAQPVQAWWFLATKAQSTVQPQAHRGPVISPLVDSLLPHFILEPLQKTEPEQPPTAISQTPTSQLLIHRLNQPAIQPQAFTDLAQTMLQRINIIRQQHGLSPIVLNAQLSQSAQTYADLMLRQNHFSHTSPNGQTFRQRNEAAGYTNWQWMGENIARGQGTVNQVVNDWMSSPTHRQNILDPRAQEMGLGFTAGSDTYWVQEFGLQFP